MAQNTFKDYLSLVKFSHTIFAMPFAILGLALGFVQPQTQFSWKITLLVVLCMIFARNAAMAFNRIADATIDARNSRTANREIPAGIVTPKKATAFMLINVLLFIATTSFINSLCFFLSPIALLVILGYSYTKRFTALSHLVLGLGLSLAPIGAFLAVTGYFHIVPILLGAVVLFWVAGFDVIYSMQDVSFDLEEKLKSIPAWLGKSRALFTSRILHFFSILLLIIIGWIGAFGVLFWIGVICFVGLLIYQHTVVKVNDLSRVNLAFFTANGIASMVFALLAIADLLYTNRIITV